MPQELLIVDIFLVSGILLLFVEPINGLYFQSVIVVGCRMSIFYVLQQLLIKLRVLIHWLNISFQFQIIRVYLIHVIAYFSLI